MKRTHPLKQNCANTRLLFAVSFLILAVIAVVTWPRMSFASRQSTATATKPPRLDFEPGEVLVRFRDEGSTPAAPSLKDRASLSLVTPDARQILVRPERFDASEMLPGLRLAHVDPEDTLAAVEALASRPDVLYAEPNFIRRKSTVPNDARYAEQWALRNTGQQGGLVGFDIKAEQAWDVTTGSRSIVVGIVDEGIDINHPDLRDNIWRNPGEIAGNGIDDDSNGYVDDINGWDFVHNDNTVFDATGTYPSDETDAHGTHVAGIVGATGNNGVGVVGVNWQVSLMSLKFLGPQDGTTADLLKAFAYARAMRDLWTSSGGTRGANIRVLNNSYGGVNRSQAELDAIVSLGQANILFVAAAGNDGGSNDLDPQYPASYGLSNIISVAATNRFQAISGFSNTGPLSVHMSAPGEDILSTTPGGTYDFFDGTSMASPQVAGVAALLCAYSPSLTQERLRSAILYSGDVHDVSLFHTITTRRLNAAKALQTVIENDTTPPSAVSNFQLMTRTSPDPREVRMTWNAPGDDGTSGLASFYDVRFSDTPFNSVSDFEQARSFNVRPPDAPNLPQAELLKIPYRHASGYFGIRAIDNAGNAGPISSGPVSVDPVIAEPLTMTTSSPSPLSTGGTPLGLIGDDEYLLNYHLPFTFNSFNGGTGLVSISTNGALYFTSSPPRTRLGEPGDFHSTTNKLQYFSMVAGLWDDLRTDRRPGDDVYVVQPDPSRIIFRWQAVTFDTPIGPGVTRGENPVSFEIELHRNGTVEIRYGSGNHNTFPVVGMSGGQRDAYVAVTHTSEFALKDLGNADTVVFTSRNPPQPPTSDMQLRNVKALPDPVGSGQNITYTIEGFNGGPDDAVNAHLAFPLPSGTSFVSCSASEGNCAGPAVGTNGTITMDRQDLQAIRSWFLTVVARVDAPPETVLNGTATISSFWGDSNPSNNSKSGTALVAEYRVFNNVVKIAGGALHSIVCKSDGSVWAWGSNEDGQLGDGSQSFSDFVRPAPVQAQNISDAIDVAGASTHSLVLASDGTVWSFGNGFRGQVGDGTVFLRATPIKVVGLSNVKAIGVGHWLSLAVKTDGTVWSWGSNDAGELGIGTFDHLEHTTPVAVQGLTDVNKVEAGGNNPGSHVLALRNDGTVWSWGLNVDGELGNGSTSSQFTPAQIPALANVIAISAGEKHSIAVKSDGTVWTWGDNEDGQLGDGTRMDRSSPAQIALTGIVSVAAGNRHTLALRNDGTVWAWGRNDFGQLGDGTGASSLSPVQVQGLSGVTAIAAGYGFSLAIMPDGTVRSWGANTYGALGSGPNTGHSLAPVQVTGIIRVMTPTMSPDAVGFQFPSTVQIGSPTFGAELHYTTNGSEPTRNDPLVTGNTILIQRTTVLKIKAWKNGYVPSETRTGTFTVLQPANPIDDPRSFVRQQYLDFLNREPDQGGWDYWASQITGCGFDPLCMDQRRIDISAAFFIELEFQETGYVVYRLHRAAFGTFSSGPSRANVTFTQFMADRGQLVAGSGLPQSTINFANALVQRPEFLAAYPANLTNAEFVNALFDKANLTPFATERQQEIAAMNSGRTRAQVLLDVIEIPTFKTREYNAAFVLMQYFGYLRRDPDQGGYDFWLNVLNTQVPGNFRGMVCAFLTSAEYQHRFGPMVTRTDRDCGQ